MYIRNTCLIFKNDSVKKILNIPAMSLFKRGLGIGPLGPGGTTPSSLKNIL